MLMFIQYGVCTVFRENSVEFSNKAQLVVIAHDVDPIELVVWLPTLCRKMEIPYCIVKSYSNNHEHCAARCLKGQSNRRIISTDEVRKHQIWPNVDCIKRQCL
ncbi:60S ribosomal protein L7a-2 [Glycine soja]